MFFSTNCVRIVSGCSNFLYIMPFLVFLWIGFEFFLWIFGFLVVDYELQFWWVSVFFFLIVKIYIFVLILFLLCNGCFTFFWYLYFELVFESLWIWTLGSIEHLCIQVVFGFFWYSYFMRFTVFRWSYFVDVVTVPCI